LKDELPNPVSMLAAVAVEWYAGGRGEERPIAIRVGGERRGLVVESSRVEGPAVAGGPARRVFVVRDGEGRSYRVTSPGEGGGETQIEIL
jgi:hypothetical protein